MCMLCCLVQSVQRRAQRFSPPTCLARAHSLADCCCCWGACTTPWLFVFALLQADDERYIPRACLIDLEPRCACVDSAAAAAAAAAAATGLLPMCLLPCCAPAATPCCRLRLLQLSCMGAVARSSSQATGGWQGQLAASCGVRGTPLLSHPRQQLGVPLLLTHAPATTPFPAAA